MTLDFLDQMRVIKQYSSYCVFVKGFPYAHVNWVWPLMKNSVSPRYSIIMSLAARMPRKVKQGKGDYPQALVGPCALKWLPECQEK